METGTIGQGDSDTALGDSKQVDVKAVDMVETNLAVATKVVDSGDIRGSQGQCSQLVIAVRPVVAVVLVMADLTSVGGDNPDPGDTVAI